MKRNKASFAFRVDASPRIGTGHFMRCLSLAIGLKKLGSEVLFISRHLNDSLARLLDDNEILLKTLENRSDQSFAINDGYSEWLGVSQDIDAQATIDILLGRKWDWLIVDHYSINQAWEKQLRKSVSKIMVIDDLANRQHDCDLLLDQNFHLNQNQRYEGKVPEGCMLLLSPKYALLRQEFQLARQNLPARGHEVSRVLVFFGGVDLDDYTSKAIEALSTISEYSFQVDVIIGNQHPNKDKILATCHQHGYSCHVQTNKMAELIANADIGIGAGGSATWERCALGLPTITLAVAENQKQLTHDAAQACIVYAPEFGLDLVEDFKLHIEAMLKNPLLRNYISKNSMHFVDALGVSRVVNELIA